MTGGGWVNNSTYAWMAISVSLTQIMGSAAYFNGSNVENTQVIDVWVR